MGVLCLGALFRCFDTGVELSMNPYPGIIAAPVTLEPPNAALERGSREYFRAKIWQKSLFDKSIVVTGG